MRSLCCPDTSEGSRKGLRPGLVSLIINGGVATISGLNILSGTTGALITMQGGTADGTDGSSYGIFFNGMRPGVRFPGIASSLE
jgi:hypothetical protein